MIWINILFLMIIGFVPFSTTLLTQYLDQQISIFVYSFNAILAGVIAYALYFYVRRNPELVDKTIPILIGRRTGRRIVVTTLTYLVAILFSFIQLPASWFLLLLVLIPELIPDRYYARDTSP